MNSIKIALFECTPFSSNKGVAALAYSALSLINEVLGTKHINYEVYFVVWTPCQYRNTIILNGQEISFYCINPIDFSSIKRILQFVLFLFFPHKKYRYYKYLTFDYALNAGSGDSFADIYGKQRFKRINSHYKICRWLHIPQIALPQTIGPFENTDNRKNAVISLQNCSFILSRDLQSFEYSTKNLNTKTEKNYELIDMAFFLPYTPIFLDDNKDIINVGINVSGLLWRGGYTGNNQFGLNYEYKELINMVLKRFLQTEGVIVHLIPHVLYKNKGVEDDYVVIKDIASQLNNPNVVVAPFFETPVDAKNYISSLDFFTGARMHSTIAAFSSNVPVVPMSYSRKFEGLFCDTLHYDKIVHMCTDDLDTSISTIFDVFNNRNAIRDEIIKTNSTIVMKKKKTICDILSAFFKI